MDFKQSLKRFWAFEKVEIIGLILLVIFTKKAASKLFEAAFLNCLCPHTNEFVVGK
jgi:hypothetical protein